MKKYKSNNEFFDALRHLIHRIEGQGNIAAAQKLQEGFSCLNGLTDGWALLMESIDNTISENHGKIEPRDMAELQQMLKAVRRAVYRK